MGARHLLFDPILEHIQANVKFRRLRIIASKKKTVDYDLRYYAVNFCAVFTQQVQDDMRFAELRKALEKQDDTMTIHIRYLHTDILASMLIVGDQLSIMSPTHGVEDYEQVKSFNIGLIVPREDQADGQQIWGNNIIQRHSTIFQEMFGDEPDEIWKFHRREVTIEKATWSLDGNTLKFDIPTRGQFNLTSEQLNSLIEGTKAEGRLINLYPDDQSQSGFRDNE